MAGPGRSRRPLPADGRLRRVLGALRFPPASAAAAGATELRTAPLPDLVVDPTLNQVGDGRGAGIAPHPPCVRSEIGVVGSVGSRWQWVMEAPPVCSDQGGWNNAERRRGNQDAHAPSILVQAAPRSIANP
jgi:hypothetical protein